MLETIPLAFAVYLCTETFCGAQSWPFEPQTDMADVEVPIYESHNPMPVAVLRAGKIYSDFEKVGFFRIGTLPLGVAENVSVELRDTFRLPETLNALGVRFAPAGGGKRGIEARNFSLTFRGETQGTLKARVVRLDKSAEWKIDDGALTFPHSRPVQFRCGTFIMQGIEAGVIKFETTNGLCQIHVFSLKSG